MHYLELKVQRMLVKPINVHIYFGIQAWIEKIKGEIVLRVCDCFTQGLLNEHLIKEITDPQKQDKGKY